MGADSSGRRGWKKAVIAAVCVVAVIAGFMAWMVAELRSDVPETVTASSFVACGRSYDLLPGYLAYDYGSRPGAEVPSGHTIFNVHSVEPGATAPETPDQIFESWPAEIAELVVGAPYRNWLRSLTLSPKTSTWLGGVSYEAGCRVSVDLIGQGGVDRPRPQDWAIVIYEAKGGDSTIADDLEAWRASELTD